MWLLKIKRLCSWFERLEINFWLAKPSQFLAWIPFKYILSLYYLSSLFVSGHHHITPWLLKSFSFSFYLSYSKPPFPQLYKKYWFFFSYFPNFKRIHSLERFSCCQLLGITVLMWQLLKETWNCLYLIMCSSL